MVIVNLNKYQILLKTVELGSITRAAEALGYTQSAVSRVIADLEREWDMELLTRSRTGVVLSSSGAALLPYVQAVCNAGRELEEQVAELHGLTRGTLRVDTFASASIHSPAWGGAPLRQRVHPLAARYHEGVPRPLPGYSV